MDVKLGQRSPSKSRENYGDEIACGDQVWRSKRIRIEGDLFVDVSEESRPLSLNLKKSDSLVNLIQKKLSDESKILHSNYTLGQEEREREKEKEKIKASNFPTSSLKIGSWEKIAVNEGNIVTKYYFAKRKLVWEILECKLKRKIEIQWSDISAIRASFPEKAYSILEVELKKPPMFFEEKDPQPKKHTLWHPSADFTGGQASMYRIHHLKFPEGTLKKNYEKLVAYDSQMKILSQKPFPSSDSPFFPTTQDSTNFSLYSLDFMSQLRNPFNKTCTTQFSQNITNTTSAFPQNFVRNRNSASFHPMLTTNNLKQPNFPVNDVVGNTTLSGFLPTRQVQNIGMVRPFTTVFNSNQMVRPSKFSRISYTSGVTSNNYHFGSPTFPNPSDPFLARSADPHVPRVNGFFASGLYNSFPSQHGENFGTTEPRAGVSSVWKLEDIVDHLFDDQPTSTDPDAQGLIKKIKSMDAHLNSLPDVYNS